MSLKNAHKVKPSTVRSIIEWGNEFTEILRQHKMVLDEHQTAVAIRYCMDNETPVAAFDAITKKIKTYRVGEHIERA